MTGKRAFVLNGSSVQGDPTDCISRALEQTLSAHGWETERMDVHSTRIRPCMVCSACAFRMPGECALIDEGRDIPRYLAQAEVFAFVVGIRFGGYPAAAKRALERTLPVVHPCFERYRGEMHHRLRYPRHPFMLFVGWQPAPDEAARALYTRLTERNALNYQAEHRTLVLSGEPSAEQLNKTMESLVRSIREDV